MSKLKTIFFLFILIYCKICFGFSAKIYRSIFSVLIFLTSCTSHTQETPDPIQIHLLKSLNKNYFIPDFKISNEAELFWLSLEEEWRQTPIQNPYLRKKIILQTWIDFLNKCEENKILFRDLNAFQRLKLYLENGSDFYVTALYKYNQHQIDFLNKYMNHLRLDQDFIFEMTLKNHLYQILIKKGFYRIEFQQNSITISQLTKYSLYFRKVTKTYEKCKNCGWEEVPTDSEDGSNYSVNILLNYQNSVTDLKRDLHFPGDSNNSVLSNKALTSLLNI